MYGTELASPLGGSVRSFLIEASCLNDLPGTGAYEKKEGPVMSKKILVVDDEPDILTFLCTLLRKNGYDVCEACDGVEGMKKVLEEKPDLVCLDLLMPEKTGIKMYREMRKDELLKNLPVIMVTGIEAVEPWEFKGFQQLHTRTFHTGS